MKQFCRESIIKLFIFSLIGFTFGVISPVSSIADSIALDEMVLVNAGGFMRGLNKPDSMGANKTKIGISSQIFMDESPEKMI